MKNIFSKLLFLLAFIAIVPACTEDFEEINTNPNAPVSVNASLLLPQTQRDMINTLMGETWGIGNIVIQHTSKNQFVNEDRYLWGEINGIWDRVYNEMRDINNILAQSEALGQNNYKGIALVMKSWMFSVLTDCYGDAPYTQAGRGKEGFIYPEYDTQESIYNGILADLTEANNLLGSTGEVVSGDLIFGGNTDKWKKLANSLRIRALMRISRKRNVSVELTTILNAPTTFPIFESNADNAVYNYLAASPDQFPLYTTRIGSFNEFRASKTLLDTLVGLDDDRLSVFFRATPDTEGTDSLVYAGLPNGLSDVNALQYNGGPQYQSRVSEWFYEQCISSYGLTVAKGVVMTYAELQFLLAEASAKGLIANNTTQYYTNGVNASFEFYGLTPSATYLSQPEVALTGDKLGDLNKIGLQKWVALFYQGLEAWFDWRRTRIPALVAGPSNQNNDSIPVRFTYPIIEQSLNGSNREVAVERQGADQISTKMWHLK